MITHLDLFSGIGGFAYAADEVFGDVEHIFCDNDEFCRAILNKHWPESEIYDDIKKITADTDSSGLQGKNTPGETGFTWPRERIDILTGGFPCQPFSAAGLRRGTADDRHLWPEMLRVIRLARPTWVIAENVGGILTWNDGLVFEQVCTDLEAAGYAVQPFVIPAVAVNAPHRRDRVWFVANSIGGADRGAPGKDGGSTQKERLQERHQMGKPSESSEVRQSWSRDWTEVAAELCGVDDGLPGELGELKLTKPQHRTAQLKAYGNAIVPQVAMEIMRSMVQ